MTLHRRWTLARRPAGRVREDDLALVAAPWVEPDLPDGALQPGYAGIRPKITPKGAPAADFVLQSPTVHGVPGLINLFGIESPGLTSAIALADLVGEAVG